MRKVFPGAVVLLLAVGFTAPVRAQAQHPTLATVLEAATGRVLISEFVAEDRAVRATIDVTYRPEPPLGLPVPVEMASGTRAGATAHASKAWPRTAGSGNAR